MSSLLIVFSDIFTDSRALLLAQEISKYEDNVVVISLQPTEHIDTLASARCIYITRSHHKRNIIRWIDFFKKSVRAGRLLIKDKFLFDNIIASDLYSLPVADKIHRIQSRQGKTPKLIYDSREIYSALGSLAKRKFSQAVISYIERKYLSSVHTVLASGQMDIDYLKTYFPKHLQYKLLLNLPPFQARVQSSYLRDRFSIAKEKLIAIYQGAVSEGRGLKPAIEAFSSMPEWHLCIVGGGPETSNFEELAKGHKNISFTGLIPYNELHSVTCSADLGLAVIEPISLSYSYALPNKLFEYFMAGLPVLVTDLPQMKEVISQTGGAIVIEGNPTAEKIQNTLAAIKSKSDLDSMVSEAEKAASNYCYSSQADIILDIINKGTH